MSERQIRRLLFLGFLIQEGIVFVRSSPEEREHAPVPPYPAILGLGFLAPLFLHIPLPRWLERVALSLQIAGWLLELAAVSQLARQKSFGIHPTAATTLVQGGVYRLEHPIYVGILLSVLGWTLPFPPSLIATLLIYLGFRRAVRAERAHLASLNVRHRGLESGIWPEVE